jgi:hypothetical protein
MRNEKKRKKEKERAVEVVEKGGRGGRGSKISGNKSETQNNRSHCSLSSLIVGWRGVDSCISMPYLVCSLVG